MTLGVPLPEFSGAKKGNSSSRGSPSSSSPERRCRRHLQATLPGRGLSLQRRRLPALGEGGVRGRARRRRRRRRARPASFSMDPPLHLREFQALVDRAGGRARLLLVGEAREGDPAPRALLETFARDLFAEPEPRKEQEAARAQPDPAGARRIRVRVGGRGSARSGPPCALLFVLFRAASLAPEAPPARARRERLRLREILRDVRSQLPSAARPGVVGVVVLGSGRPGEGEGARLQLDALLRQVFGRRRPAEPETLQAAPYGPGAGQGAAEARAAACRALRAALKLRADGAEAKKKRIPAFLQCIPWARRSRQKEGHLDTGPGNFSEDASQDPEEGVSLTNMEPNGNCEEACCVAAT